MLKKLKNVSFHQKIAESLDVNMLKTIPLPSETATTYYQTLEEFP